MNGYQHTIEDYLSRLPTKARGATCEDEDVPRLSEQCVIVYRYMRDLRPHTLRELSAGTSVPEASVSARIREIRAYLEGRPLRNDPPELKRPKLGTVLRDPVPGGNGLNTYTLRLNRYFGAA